MFPTSLVFARLSVCHEYPYLLPCLVIAIINLIAFIVSAVLLPETKDFPHPLDCSKTEGAENQKSTDAERNGQTSSEGRSDTCRAAENSPISYWPPNRNLNRLKNGDNNKISNNDDNNNANVQNPRRKRYHTYGAHQRLEDAYCVEKKPQFLLHDSLPPVYIVRDDSCNNSFRQNKNHIVHNDLNDYPAIDAEGESTSLLPENKPELCHEGRESLFGRGPLTVMLLYGVYSCIAVTADEITPGTNRTVTGSNGFEGIGHLLYCRNTL